MATAAEQERLWYKTALADVMTRLPQREYSDQEKDQIRGLVLDAVRFVIMEHHPVTAMEWYNLADEFKMRALTNVRWMLSINATP